MEVTNDNGCSWVKDLIPRTNIKTLQSNEDSEWLVIGAGYTGLSAARKLGQLYPNQKIIIVDAQLAGEGASSRNSGYLVDTTLNDGFTSNKELDNYKKKFNDRNLEFDITKFNKLDEINRNLILKKETLEQETERLGDELISELQAPIDQEPLRAGQSTFFKTVYQNPSRNPQNQFVIDPE